MNEDRCQTRARISERTPPYRSVFSIVAAVVLLLATASPSFASGTQTTPFAAAIVYEPVTGTVLYAKNAHQKLPTASMIKMVTALVIMDDIEHGRLRWETPVEVSYDVARVGGSQVYLKQGEVFTVAELMKALLIKSANDAAAALAEASAGSVDAFVPKMRAKVRELGIDGSRIYSPNGLPSDAGPQRDDRLSAWDLAVIGSEVLSYPTLRKLVGTRLTWFRDGEFQLLNSNHLVRDWNRATGIKTGYHVRSGFCVTASARQNGMELIAVVIGCKRKHDCFASARRLLDDAFREYRLVVPIEAGDPLPTPAAVRGGSRSSVPLVAATTIAFVVPRDDAFDPRVVVLPRSLSAPVEQGENAARVVVRDGTEVLGELPAVAASDVAPQSWWQRIKATVLSILGA